MSILCRLGLHNWIWFGAARTPFLPSGSGYRCLRCRDTADISIASHYRSIILRNLWLGIRRSFSEAIHNWRTK